MTCLKPISHVRFEETHASAVFISTYASSSLVAEATSSGCSPSVTHGAAAGSANRNGNLLRHDRFTTRVFRLRRKKVDHKGLAVDPLPHQRLG